MAPSNDNFANASAITGATGLANGTNVSATAESGEPANNGATVWWKWTCPSTANYFFALNRAAQTFPGIIRVFQGIVVNNLSEVTYLDDEHNGIGNGLEWAARVAFQGIANQVYYIRVDARTNVAATPGPWNASAFYGPTQAVTYTSAILNNTAIYVAHALTQGNQPDISPQQWIYQGPNEGTFQINWGDYYPIQLGACGECPVQFVSAVQQDCLGNAGLTAADVNASCTKSICELNAASPGVFQFIPCGGSMSNGVSWAVIGWGNTFSAVAAAIGGGMTGYATAAEQCANACLGFTGTGAYTGYGGGSYASTFNPGQVAYTLGADQYFAQVFVSKQTIYPPLPYYAGYPIDAPWNQIPTPSPLPPFYDGQTDYAAGAQVTACCCNSTSLGCSDGSYTAYQANQSIQGSDIPAGVNQLTGLNNAYWVGGENEPLENQCSPFNLYGGTFNSGECGIIYYAGIAGGFAPGPRPLPPGYSVNVSYIPMFPNLVFDFGGYPYYPNTAFEANFGIKQNLSNQFTWPNVTLKLVPGPNNLTGPSVNVPVAWGDVPPSFNQAGYANFNFNSPAFPFVLEFEVYMNGILAGTMSYTIQPAVSATYFLSPISGYQRYSFTMKNSGYGVSENLKFSASCNNPAVLFSYPYFPPGTTQPPNNQPSLNNLPLFQYFGTGSAQPEWLFFTNKLDGNTPVQITVTFEDDTFTYPAMVIQVTL